MPACLSRSLSLSLSLMAELVILDSGQLHQLAEIIYQEAEAIRSIKFKSEPEVAQYLSDCQANYECIRGLLAAATDLKNRYEGDSTRAPIADDIFQYTVNGANFALQIVRNYTLRSNYLSKIREHASAIMDALKTLDPGNVINVRCLAKDAVLYRNAMLEYTRKYQSTASRNFSRWLKESGIKFDELVKRYQAKLGFEGRPFQNLEDSEKIQVYEEIMKASGRGRVIVNKLSTVSGAAGIALILLTVGLMVWDIFSSEHVIQTATRDAVVTVASVGGAMLGEVVGAAVATQLVGVQGSALFVAMAGIVTGLAGAFLLGSFAGFLVDLIFGGGGDTIFSTEGLRCYVAPMPDGRQLARQIAHP